MDERSEQELASRLIGCLDLTNLDDGCNEADIDALLARADTPVGPVAAVCVWPRFVKRCAGTLGGGPVRVATVVNFPHGGEDTEAACREAAEAVRDGADEIDMVIAYRRVADDPAFVERQVQALKTAVDGRRLKAILETGEFVDDELVRAASRAAISGGADFIKTSTGKVQRGASPEAARAMLAAIRESGGRCGLKVSGGVRTFADARRYLELCEDTMGAGWASPERFRIGASGLLDDLLLRARPSAVERLHNAPAGSSPY